MAKVVTTFRNDFDIEQALLAAIDADPRVENDRKVAGTAFGAPLSDGPTDVAYTFAGSGFSSDDPADITVTTIRLISDAGKLSITKFSANGGEIIDTLNNGGIGALGDLLFGGNDLIVGGRGDDDFGGGAGNDVIRSKGGDDFLEGGEGNDSLIGGGGADELFGDDGNDRLTGGAGADFLSGGDDDDKLFGKSGNDILRGDDGNDTLVGSAGNDDLDGGEGRDRLLGGGGNDVLDGGADNDNLKGGGGADTLIGGEGDDVLLGGGGPDTMVFADGHGDDTVKRFGAGQDMLDLSDVTAIADFDDLTAALSQVGDDAVIDTGGGSITLENVLIGDLSEGDFIFS